MRDKNDDKKKRTGTYIIVAVLFVSLIGVSLFAFIPWSTLFPPDEQVPDSTVKLTSTFTLIDYRTGEDVSAWVEISVYTPDPDDLPFDENDAQTIGNFDEDESSKDAEDVAIDLRSHAVAWLEIDPDFESDYGGYNTVFNPLATRDMRKLIGGGNFDYRVYVYHAPSNVSVNVLNRGNMDGVFGDDTSYNGDMDMYNNTWINIVAGSAFNRGQDGNYTVFLNMPLNSDDGWHSGISGGDEWNIDDDEEDAMELNEINWLSDQSNFRSITPYYDLTDDTNDAYASDFEQVTNVFGIRFGFNVTLSTVAGNDAFMNFTLSSRDYNDIPAIVEYDDTDVWVLFYEPITCYDSFYNFDITMDFGDHIYLGNVTTCRVLIPSDEYGTLTETTMNAMPIDLYAQHG